MNRLLQGKVAPDDRDEVYLRPKTLAEFIGHEEMKANLQVFIEAARRRGDVLDHVLFSGPPGLGKTTLAHIIAHEMGAGQCVVTSGPMLAKAIDLAGILTRLKRGDVLFIDEIHRLQPAVEEFLYSAMEDFRIDIVLDSGPQARNINVKLEPFTLIGATTRMALLSSPLIARFGIQFRLNYYRVEELKEIVIRSAKLLGVEIDEGGAYEVALRSRGTPRIANRLLRRVRDFAEVSYGGMITKHVAQEALNRLGIDRLGLDEMDKRILSSIIERYQGGPVGLKAIASILGEDEATIEEVYEPYLLMQGLIERTPRGRKVTEKAYKLVDNQIG